MFQKRYNFSYTAAIIVGTLSLGSPALAEISHGSTEYAASGPSAFMASGMSSIAYDDAIDTFGDLDLRPGGFKWLAGAAKAKGSSRVVISLTQQMAYVYKGEQLIGVSTLSSGKPGKDTPEGVFPILEKKPMHHSRKYDNAPMPFMQRIDEYGIALHAGHNPGVPASHGCVRLPPAFAAKLHGLTQVGDQVIIES
jgi:lipoprotein-anchoring transpeptidase ErfK/SrfK